MRRIVWISSGLVAAAGVGAVIAKTAETSLASMATTRSAETFEVPAPAKRISDAYHTHAEVAVSTVEPFSGNGTASGRGSHPGVRPDVKDEATHLLSKVRGVAPKSDRGPADEVGSRTPAASGALSELAALAEAGGAPLSFDALSDAATPETGSTEALTAANAYSSGQDHSSDILTNWQSQNYLDNPLVGSVYRADGKRVSESTLLGAATGARYVLLGEIHDNPDHHRIQAEIVGGLARLGETPSVVFEMIPESFVDTLEGFTGFGVDDLEALGQRLEWSERGWPDFSTYRPIFEAALKNGLSVHPGDLDREVIASIAEDGVGALDRAEIERLGLDTPLDPKVEADLEAQIREAHCGLMPETALDRMAAAQRARDGALADAMADAAKTSGSAILIAGAGHTRTDRGVPSLLEKKDPSGSSVSVRMVEVTEAGKSSKDYGVGSSNPAPYDYTIFTPRGSLEDHCAALRERMSESPASDSGR